MQSFNSLRRMFGVTTSTCFVVLSFCTAAANAQQSMPMPKPTPAPAPAIRDVNSIDNASKDDMDDDMMGAPGLMPPGIMVGKAGRWMVGYQVMFDKMEGNRIGTREVSTGTILSRFMASPTDMTMQMHMGMVMYSPTDNSRYRKTFNLETGLSCLQKQSNEESGRMRRPAIKTLAD